MGPIVADASVGGWDLVLGSRNRLQFRARGGRQQLRILEEHVGLDVPDARRHVRAWWRAGRVRNRSIRYARRRRSAASATTIQGRHPPNTPRTPPRPATRSDRVLTSFQDQRVHCAERRDGGRDTATLALAPGTEARGAEHRGHGGGRDIGLLPDVQPAQRPPLTRASPTWGRIGRKDQNDRVGHAPFPSPLPLRRSRSRRRRTRWTARTRSAGHERGWLGALTERGTVVLFAVLAAYVGGIVGTVERYCDVVQRGAVSAQALSHAARLRRWMTRLATP